jgi:hypothetical protein
MTHALKKTIATGGRRRLVMTEEEIRNLIKTTAQEVVREMRTQGMTREADDANYRDISEMLREYYRNGEKDKQIAYALQSVRFDPYFRIIEKYYKHGEKIDLIAADFEVDSSTIVRKKRELCLRVYQSL